MRSNDSVGLLRVVLWLLWLCAWVIDLRWLVHAGPVPLGPVGPLALVLVHVPGGQHHSAAVKTDSLSYFGPHLIEHITHFHGILRRLATSTDAFLDRFLVTLTLLLLLQPLLLQKMKRRVGISECLLRIFSLVCNAGVPVDAELRIVLWRDPADLAWVSEPIISEHWVRVAVICLILL